MSRSPSARGTTLLMGAVLALLVGLLFREALFDGEVLSQADFLRHMPPWSGDGLPADRPGNPTLSDQAAQFQPWALIAERQLADGVPPLWNPHAGGGQPLLANLQSALLSPFALWLLLLPFGLALLAIALSKLLIAGLGTALLARRLGCSPAGACVAGLAWAFGGYVFLWLGHPHSAAAALLPVVLLLVERWLDEGGRGWLPVLWAVVVAALVLCGHVETTLHVALIAVLWAVARSAGRPARARLATLARLLGWAVAGALVAAVQWLPFAEYLFESTAYAQRSGLQETWRAIPWETLPWVLAALALLVAAFVCGRRAAAAQQRGRWGPALLGALGVAAAGAAALSLLDASGQSTLYRSLWWPDAWGNPVPARGLPWAGPRAYVNVNGGYAGVVVLPLALVGLLCAPPRRLVQLLAGLWLLGFVLGYETPIVSHLVNRLPVMNLSVNYRMTLLVGFAGGLLAGFGLDALTDAVRRRRPLATALLLGAAIAVGVALSPRLPWPAEWLPAPSWPDSFPEPTAEKPYVRAALELRWPLLGATAVLLLVAAAVRRGGRPAAGLRLLAVALLGADLYGFGRGFNPSAPPEEIFPSCRVIDWLRAQPGPFRVWSMDRGTLPAETAGVYGLDDVRGYDALNIERMALARELLRPGPGAAAPDSSDVLDVSHPLFGLLDVGYVLAPPTWSPPEGAALARAFAVPGCNVWRNDGWRARAFVCGEAQDIRPYVEQAVASSDAEPQLARRRLARNLGVELGLRWRGTDGPPPVLLVEGDAPPAVTPFTGEARRREHAVLHQAWDVEASADGWLCVSEPWFPGWVAQVNGQDAPIAPAFFGLRAVRVPAGSSTVTFRYEPASARWGLVLSGIGLLAVGVGAVRRRRA